MGKRISHSDKLAKDRAKGLYEYCKIERVAMIVPLIAMMNTDPIVG